MFPRRFTYLRVYNLCTELCTEYNLVALVTRDGMETWLSCVRKGPDCLGSSRENRAVLLILGRLGAGDIQCLSLVVSLNF